MFTEEDKFRIEVLEDGQIQVRRTTHILEDGVEVATKLPHRHVIHPGQDLEVQNDLVKAVASVVHTPQTIAAWKLAEAERAP